MTAEITVEQKNTPIFRIFNIDKQNTINSNNAENDNVSITPVVDKLKKFGVVTKNRQINIIELFRFESFIIFMFYLNAFIIWLNQTHR